MGTKQETKWEGTSTGNFFQGFANFFNNVSQSDFFQHAKQVGSATTDTSQRAIGTTTQDTSGTSEQTSTGAATTENKYGYMTREAGASEKAYQDWVNTQANASDPSLKYAAGAAMRSARNRYGGPFGAGAGSSAATRQQMFKSEEGGIREKEGQGLIEDAFRRRQQMGGNLQALAGLEAGRTQLVNLGGTTTTTGKTSGTQTGKAVGTSDLTSTGTSKTATENTSDVTGGQTTKSSGEGGGYSTGTQTTTEAGKQTTSSPWWSGLLGGAAQGGASAASAAKMAGA